MEKVLNKLDSFKQELNTMNTKFDAKFESMDQKFNFKLNIILWAFGVLLAVMTIFRFTS